MTLEINPNMQYIRSHIESDIALNRTISGKDYSREMARVLALFMVYANNQRTVVLEGVIGISKLEQDLSIKSGDTVIFHESKKCGLAVHELYKENKVEDLSELIKYCGELLTRPLK